MKKIPYSRNRNKTAAKQVACTVSAAALMLGVSQAATVGFNFQVDWTEHGSPAYTGKPVTATAFGIATNGWENLTPLPTGYTASNPGPFTTNEVIDATTSTGGLNPLPQGSSIQVTWSCTAANSSGFAGYGIPYGGPSPHPGNEEVYYGFLRDEANIYTQPVGGPIPYGVTITGLRSVWTNTPYAIELIASTDTGNILTNAFIGSLVSTQQVTYDVYSTNTGIMGGLSTMSGPWTNDSITIRGAPSVSHSTGFAVASTIAGFIITDKPVITMPPQAVVVSPGDTITWSGYACGVPPLSYQWRKGGVPIAGATLTSYSITNVSAANFASYDLVVSNLYGVASSSPVPVDGLSASAGNNYTVDTNPSLPPQDGLVLGATWLASSLDAGGITRTGVMSFKALDADQITVSGSTNFDSAIGTIMFWMRSSGLSNTNGKPATLFDRLNGNGLVLMQNVDGSVELKASQNAQDLVSSNLADNKWHHVAVTYDQGAGGEVNLYIDGQSTTSGANSSAWSWQAGQEIELGLSHDTNAYQAFNGLLDDVRVYNRVLLATEVTTAFSSGGLVDTNALTMQLNFDAAPSAGVTLKWQCPDAILQSAASITGPFLDVPGAVSPHPAAQRSTVKFYRYRGHVPQQIVSNPYLM